MTKSTLSILPQDVSPNLASIIRTKDPNATIYPTTIVLTETKQHFTNEEISYIIQRQSELFQLTSKEVRVFVIRSKELTQEQVSSLLYIDRYNKEGAG